MVVVVVAVSGSCIVYNVTIVMVIVVKFVTVALAAVASLGVR